MLTLQDIGSLSDSELRRIPVKERRELLEGELIRREKLKMEDQLFFYKPVSEEARSYHLSTAKERVITGGNRSSKSETQLVELVIALTGEIPDSLSDVYPKPRFSCPTRCRLVVQSLTNTWEQVIKAKLQWNQWSGRGDFGGLYGHWGWIPRRFLIKGSWAESWSEKNRTLTLVNGSTCQINSYDQDTEDFSGSSLHFVCHDEGPPHSIYRENKMRTIDVGGRLSIAMTPPDEESAAWDAAWVYDEIYEKGLAGPGKEPQIDSFTFFTEQNHFLEPQEIELVFKSLTPAQKETRGHGRFLHLGGRIFPFYSERLRFYCFSCNDSVIMEKKKCSICGSEVFEYCHYVEPFESAYKWPVIYLLDPHPRKPNMMSWVAIDPADDWWQIAELEVDGTPEKVKMEVDKVEEKYKVNIAHRIIDPNMGRSPAHNAGRRHITVRDEYAAVGLRLNDSVSDDFMVGKNRVTSMLKPDSRSKSPRFHLFQTCLLTNSQLNKWTWDEWSRYSSDKRDSKQRPREKHDDFPKLLIYLANFNPSFGGLQMGMRPLRAMNHRRKGAY